MLTKNFRGSRIFLVAALLFWCQTQPGAEQVLAPQTQGLSVGVSTTPMKFPFEVGYYVNPADRKLQRYQQLESGFRAVAEKVFRGVRQVEQDPIRGISTLGLLATFVPRRVWVEDKYRVWQEVSLWACPLGFGSCLVERKSIDGVKVSLSASLYDSKGNLVWATEIQRYYQSATGGDYGFLYKKAFDELIAALAGAIVDSKEIDIWARSASSEYAEKVGPPPLAIVKELGEKADRAMQGGEQREALKYYISALQYTEEVQESRLYRDEGSKEEQDLRQQIIRLARGLTPPPAIPEDAYRQLVYGVAATKDAKTTADYEKAAREFQRAVRLAPWWADAYLNLAVALEGAGKYADAAKSLEFFLLAAPNDPEAKRLQNKIYELEYRAKTQQKK